MTEWEKKREVFRRLNARALPGQIVFAGSSLMEQFPVGEFWPGSGVSLRVYDRGIGGYTCADLLASLEECVCALRPAHVFLNIGTNDMNGPDYALPALLESYSRILAGIRAGAPEAALWLLAYYPVCPGAARDDWARQALRWRTNRRIDEANAALPALAARWNACFLDVGGALRDEAGALKAAYTPDGIHLFPDAYWQVWQALLPTLRELN